MGTTQQPRNAFIGRQRELGELLDALREADAGRGGLVILGGEPGIGKSRLADELARRARETGHRVVAGRGWDDAGAPPYWPWVQVLRSYVRNEPPEAVREEMSAGAQDIAQMLPELRTLFVDLARRPDRDSESARFQLFDSTTTFLRNAGRRGTLVIIFDDLHAADTPSLLLLRFLATQLADARILVVATYRDVELTPDHPLAAALSQLARESTTRILSVGGIPEAAVGALIASAAGVELNARMASTLWRETGGNPLFLTEAVRLLDAEGRLDPSVAGDRPMRLAVPTGIREVITRRVGRLGERTIRALTFAAALGPEFSAEVVRLADDYSPDELQGLLNDALAAGLLATATSGAGRYRFSHDLVRETLYRDLPPADRIRVHRRIADVLEQSHASAPDGHLAELAHHFFEAAQADAMSAASVDAAFAAHQAATYARRAAEHASRSLAYEEAARLYRVALAALSLEQSSDAATRSQILLALGDAEGRAGDLDTARATFMEAARVARRLGAATDLARAALGYGGRFMWARAGADVELIPLLQDALVLLGGTDDRLRVRLLVRLACAWRDSAAHREQSAALSRQAVEISRTLDDPATLSYVLAGRYWAIWWPNNPDERVQIAIEMLAVANATGDAERIIDSRHMLYLSYVDLGRMDEARAEHRAVVRLAEELRQPAQAWIGSANRTLIALLEGRFSDAEELMAREMEPGQASNPVRDDISAARMHRFLLRREQGRLAEEEATVHASVEEFPWYPLHRAALACLLAELGRPAEARLVLEELATDRFGALNRDNEWLLTICLASDASCRLADADAAAALYEQLLPFAGRHAVGHPEGSMGATDRYLGMLAATMDRPDDAERHFLDAIRFNEKLGSRPWGAHTRHDLARLLIGRDAPGDRERAAVLLEQSIATARALGMAALEREMADEDPALNTGRHERAAEAVRAATLRREGEYWTVEFDQTRVRIRDTKGMRYLGRLLADPGREFHALDLVGLAVTLLGTPDRTRLITSSENLAVSRLSDSGPRLDPEAKDAYRRRLAELREDAAEAGAWNDDERAARVEQEIDFLTRELAGAIGIGGRDRKAGAAAERARINVTRAIRSALLRIGELVPALGRHFDVTIHTGTFCSYRPDPLAALTWQL